MSSANARYPALPSRMSLMTFKTRLKGAQKGHSLLKKKADALMFRYRQMQGDLYNAKMGIVDQMKHAHFSVTSAVFVAGDITFAVQESLKMPAFKTAVRLDNIAGVAVPSLIDVSGQAAPVTGGKRQRAAAEAAGAGGGASSGPAAVQTNEDGSSSSGSAFDQCSSGIARGGEQLREARQTFRDMLNLTLKVASLQVAWVTLDEALKVTNRRVNALDKVVIPKVQGTISYITSEMDEMEREEFFRLKMVQKKKRRATEARRQEQLKEMAAEEAASGQSTTAGGGAAAGRAAANNANANAGGGGGGGGGRGRNRRGGGGGGGGGAAASHVDVANAPDVVSGNLAGGEDEGEVVV